MLYMFNSKNKLKTFSIIWQHNQGLTYIIKQVIKEHKQEVASISFVPKTTAMHLHAQAMCQWAQAKCLHAQENVGKGHSS